MTRPQKVTNLRDAENKKLSTWLPSNGTGIGLWKGRRVYYVNGKRQSGLTIRNPITDSVGQLTIGGMKNIWGVTKDTLNATLGMASPWNLAAMGRTKRNIEALGIKEKNELKQPTINKPFDPYYFEKLSKLQAKTDELLKKEDKVNNVKEGQEPEVKINNDETNVKTGSTTAVKETKGKVPESKGEAGSEYLKSDVFTINPETGEPLGVLTKSQRIAFDKKNQAWLKKNRNKLRTYTIKGKPVKRYG